MVTFYIFVGLDVILEAVVIFLGRERRGFIVNFNTMFSMGCLRFPNTVKDKQVLVLVEAIRHCGSSGRLELN